ncbi:NINE protein, partial [Bordetella bronchiseptica]
MTQAHLSVPGAARRPRSKIALGLLACALGWIGAHWWYLGRRRAWMVTLAAILCLAATQWF